jgi:cyclin T
VVVPGCLSFESVLYHFKLFLIDTAKIMECDWYFTKEELTAGYTPDELKHEVKLRRNTCAFLQEAGMKLGLPQLTIATAIVFFHRFYATRKFSEYERYIIATTCLFLAGKVEETPKKIRDIIAVTELLRNKDKKLDLESPEFWALRENILTHELIVLQTIAFDMTIEHPYKYLLMYVKQIQAGNKSLAQVAWNFVNDSLRTTLCLQFKPQLIASAAIYLASKFLKHPLPEGAKPWWEVFNAKIEDLEEISNQILDLYESPGTVNSPIGNTNTVSGQSPPNLPNNSPHVPPPPPNPPPPANPPPPPPPDNKPVEQSRA